MKKIKNSFFAIIIGIILIITGIILIFWNENNAVKNIAVVDELKKVVIDVSSDDIKSSNDGKLVNVSGKLKLNSNTTDNTFYVKVESPKLVRTVEMYQWIENCKTDSNDKTSCSYTKEWCSSLLNSNNYKDKGYRNPTYMQYQSDTMYASVKLGNYNVSKEQLKQLDANKVYNSFQTLPIGYKQNGNYVTNSKNFDDPQIGDIRIKFTYSDSTQMTILAEQQGNNLVDYITKKETKINSVSDGIKTSSEMILQIEKANNNLKWIIRAVCLVLEIVGVISLFGPITTLSSFVPILGDIVGTAISLVGILVGSIITLVCTAIAWFVYRPVLVIILLVVSAVLGYILVKFIKSKKQTI